MKALVTGGLGFIGSNLVRKLLDDGHKVHILDCETYAASPEWVREHPLAADNCYIHTTDLRDFERTKEVVAFTKPEAIFHLAAESHVCRSVEGPRDFIETNVLGTFNLLESIRQLRFCKEIRFLHCSTDEVFGELCLTDPPFSNKSQIKPRSPYAASKAASDHLVMSYIHTYGLDAVVTNCSNNFGPNQHYEKLVPKTILSFFAGQPMTIYGNGSQIRDWIHVDDHIQGMLLAADKGAIGGRYLFGGSCEMRNIEIVTLIAEMMAKEGFCKEPQIKFVMDGRPTDDLRYAIDNRHSEICLDYAPKTDLFVKRIKETIEWYKARL